MRNYIIVMLLAAVFVPACPDAGARGIDLSCGPWIQNVSETGFTLMWATADKSLSWVEVAPDDGTPFEAARRPGFYQTVAGKKYTGTFHKVRVEGLEPGKAYRYRILGKNVVDDSDPYGSVYGSEGTLKLIGTVMTADPGADTCRFSMVNDIHDNASLYTSLVSPVKDVALDFLLLNGDIVSYAKSIDTVMVHTFGPVADIVKDIPVVFARGNHEGRGADSYLVPGLFDTPTGEPYYIFRRGPVAFVVLDGGEDKPDSSVEYSGLADYDAYRQAELEWLRGAVKDPLFADAPVKVAIIHIPLIDGPGSWYAQSWLSRNFSPVLNEAGVDLMLSGHLHKHVYAEPGTCGNGFPVVVNSNKTRLDFLASGDRIRVEIYDTSDVMVQSYSFRVD